MQAALFTTVELKGGTITATPEHLLLTASGYRYTGDLEKGDELVMSGGRRVAVQDTRSVQLEGAYQRPRQNFTPNSRIQLFTDKGKSRM